MTVTTAVPLLQVDNSGDTEMRLFTSKLNTFTPSAEMVNEFYDERVVWVVRHEAVVVGDTVTGKSVIGIVKVSVWVATTTVIWKWALALA